MALGLKSQIFASYHTRHRKRVHGVTQFHQRWKQTDGEASEEPWIYNLLPFC